jgi:2'-hydroxyisoflavone reductase
MNPTRRHFISFSWQGRAWRTKIDKFIGREIGEPVFPFGGTGFTGPYQVRYAPSRGHITTFNRERRIPANCQTKSSTDRRSQRTARRAEDRQWDVAIDNPTTLPEWARDAGQILKGNVELCFYFDDFRLCRHEQRRR